MNESGFTYEIIYPKLPTRVLTLVYTYKDRKYYYAITEYDYTSLFKISFHRIIEDDILIHQDDLEYATLDTIVLLQIVDGKLII